MNLEPTSYALITSSFLNNCVNNIMPEIIVVSSPYLWFSWLFQIQTDRFDLYAHVYERQIFFDKFNLDKFYLLV